MSDTTLSQSAAFAALDFLLKNVQVSNTAKESLSQDDALEKTVAQINRLALAADWFRRVVDSQLSFYRRRRNEMVSPIIRCPDEVFAHILQFLCTARDDSHRIEDLRLVCHHFQRVVEFSPILWSYIRITTGAPLKRTSYYLLKSKSAPLTIASDFVDPNDQARALDLILEHIQRWKDVHLFLNLQDLHVQEDDALKSIRLLERLGEVATPLLEYFGLGTHRNHPWLGADVVNLFQGCAPLLRHLHIPTLPISWDNPS